MKYLGGKYRIRREIAQVLLEYKGSRSHYVEPFVGGFNLPMACCDISLPLISMYKALQQGWEPPTEVSEEDYQRAKTLPDTDPLKAFIGYLCSFGGKYFGGYARPTPTHNYVKSGINALNKRKGYLSRVHFHHLSYRSLKLENCLVYCDPPYEGVTAYKHVFNTTQFWEWVRVTSANNTVVVSEYSAPSDFRCIASITRDLRLGAINDGYIKFVQEKLFIYFP